MDELIQAGEKHKKSAIAVKEVADSLKKKVADYREREFKMMDDIYILEMEMKEKHDLYICMSLNKKLILRMK